MTANAIAKVIPVNLTKMADGTEIRAENINGAWTFSVTGATYRFESLVGFQYEEDALIAAMRYKRGIAALIAENSTGEVVPLNAPKKAAKPKVVKIPENKPVAKAPEIVANTVEEVVEEVEEKAEKPAAIAPTPAPVKPPILTLNKTPKVTRERFIMLLGEELKLTQPWAKKPESLQAYLDDVMNALNGEKARWNPTKGVCASNVWKQLGMKTSVSLAEVQKLPKA